MQKSMQIQKNKSNKKVVIIIAIALVILATGLFAYFYFQKLSPKSTEISKGTPTTPNSVTLNNDTNSDQNTDTTEPFVSSPILNPPTNTTPYPIENEHYKIEQLSESKYTITLYPLGSRDSDYNAELKAYKKEVLDYLKNRYGNISGFVFEWNPSNAESI